MNSSVPPPVSCAQAIWDELTQRPSGKDLHMPDHTSIEPLEVNAAHVSRTARKLKYLGIVFDPGGWRNEMLQRNPQAEAGFALLQQIICWHLNEVGGKVCATLQHNSLPSHKRWRNIGAHTKTMCMSILMWPTPTATSIDHC